VPSLHGGRMTGQNKPTKPDYPLILRSREAASRRMKARLHQRGLHGSPGDAKHHPETALARLLTMRVLERHQDKASTSASLSSPGTMVTGIGNEPMLSAMVVTSGPGPSAPGLAASTSMAMSASSLITSSSCSIATPSRITRSGVMAAMPLARPAARAG